MSPIEKEGSSYGLGGYLRSHGVQLVMLAALELLLAFVLLLGCVQVSIAGLVCVLVFSAAALALAADYLRQRSFWRQLDGFVGEFDRPRLAIELIGEPRFAEGRVAYDALRAVSHGAGDEVAEQRRRVEEYRGYVESWVHDAKTPIAAARLALENGNAAGVALELERVERYVDQALFYARSETLERDYLVRRHVLRDVVASAVRANASLLIGARVTPRLGDGLDLVVFTDDKWLEFMLGQLLQNSARYARPNAPDGPQIWFEAWRVGEGSADEAVELTVRDNGCGVSEAELPRVFDRGFTGENGRTHEHSTGLGLWLASRLAAKMGIAVQASSEPGESFTVTFTFPVNLLHYAD